MQPEYIAKRSMWKGLTFWTVILSFLIIPLIMIIVRMVRIHSTTYEFYSNKIIVKGGVLNKFENQMVFNKVMSVSVQKNLWGRMCNYGDVQIDTLGKWDLNTDGIKNPDGLRNYLVGKISNNDVKQFITE